MKWILTQTYLFPHNSVRTKKCFCVFCIYCSTSVCSIGFMSVQNKNVTPIHDIWFDTLHIYGSIFFESVQFWWLDVRFWRPKNIYSSAIYKERALQPKTFLKSINRRIQKCKKSWKKSWKIVENWLFRHNFDDFQRITKFLLNIFFAFLWSSMWFFWSSMWSKIWSPDGKR